ncbi:MAG: CTP synthase [Sulfolobales archaeon]|nr:CTP synthase [Sulfolobales archaeon]MDW8082598.1 CTP synthase [Sulfolobales archaeon]
MTKYVFVTGGVLSGLGKGITTASIGLILKSMGYSVTAIKIDPYVNVDAGTMNPYMHGEVFVTDDGGETDLDIGHYERFLDTSLSKDHNITTGKIYMEVITKERKGEYLGQTVQIIPHVTDEIKQKIRDVARKTSADIVLAEIGGTVGDIESLPFLEAIRQMRLEEGPTNAIFVHVVLVPKLSTTSEFKTKPAQHSFQELRRIGIQPDVIVARSESPITPSVVGKLALFGNVRVDEVVNSYDVDPVYDVPRILMEQGLGRILAHKLALEHRTPDLGKWIEFTERYRNASKAVSIAMVGKYTALRDSYLSIIEALKHAGTHLGVKPRLEWIESTDVERGKIDVRDVLENVGGAVVLPGFGSRGVEGKISVIKAFRESGKPVLGICFGLQLMVVEFARNVLGLERANTTEVDPNTPHPVVDLLEIQRFTIVKGGSMRLGALLIKISEGTLAHRIYRTDFIYERHRHRYHINPQYLDRFESSGYIVSGVSPEGYPEIMELTNHRFYFGTQAHPEFKSRPLRPSPVFTEFMRSLLHS